MTLAALEAGRLVDRVGGHRTLAAAALIHACAILVWSSLAAGAPGEAAFFVAAACVEAGVVANSAVMVSLTQQRSRAMVVGIIGTISGFTAALGPTVGAAIRSQWGSRAPFWAGLAIALVIAGVLPRLSGGRKETMACERTEQPVEEPRPGAGPSKAGAGRQKRPR